MSSNRLQNTLAGIDKINLTDPNFDEMNGEKLAKEYCYSVRMTECLAQYWPENTDELIQIAVRAQHIKRWHLKRAEFAEGRSGYMLWRKELGKLHGALTSDIMLVNGYSIEEAELVAATLRKEKLKTSLLTQTLEDVACLVFLQHYFDDFAAKHDEDKMVSIVQKTWHKMSNKAQSIAKTLTLPPHLSAIVSKALA